MKLGYVADLHGRSAHYRRLVELVGQERPRALILGGDQCPLAFQGDSAGQQRAWLRATFRDFLCAVTPLCPVYWNSGNHDLAATRDVLMESDIQQIFSTGLHEFVQDFITRNKDLGTGISEAYHFSS